MKQVKEKKLGYDLKGINLKIFGIELNNTSGSIIFIHTLVVVIFYISIISINILNYVINYSLSELLSNLLFLIPPSIFLGIYLYPLICCLKLRKIHSGNKHNTIKWFGFEINATSACILYVISIVGLVGSLSIIFGLVGSLSTIFGLFGYLLSTMFGATNNAIRGLGVTDNILGIILLLIYSYTIYRCVKVRKLVP